MPILDVCIQLQYHLVFGNAAELRQTVPLGARMAVHRFWFPAYELEWPRPPFVAIDYIVPIYILVDDLLGGVPGDEFDEQMDSRGNLRLIWDTFPFPDYLDAYPF